MHAHMQIRSLVSHPLPSQVQAVKGAAQMRAIGDTSDNFACLLRLPIAYREAILLECADCFAAMISAAEVCANLPANICRENR